MTLDDFFQLSLGSLVLFFVACARAVPAPDLIVMNAKIVTVDPKFSVVHAMSIGDRPDYFRWRRRHGPGDAQ